MLEEILSNQTMAAIVMLLVLMVAEFFKYKNTQYFNFNDPKFKFHYLITKYHMDRKRDEVDAEYLNRLVFFGALLAGVIYAVLLACFGNIFISLGAYIVLKDVFRRLIFRRVGQKYGS